MGRLCRLRAAAVVLAMLTAPLAGAAEPVGVAVFDFELIDTSLEGEMRGRDPAETERLRRVTSALREAFAAQDGYRVVDMTPAQAELEALPALESCNGCAVPVAAKLDADLAVTAFVRKISTLILYLGVTVYDVDTGAVRSRDVVSIRGNTDESWLHGLRFILRERLFADSADRP